MKMKDTAICLHCHKHVEYTIKTELNNAFIKGSEITFKKKVAYCNECGNSIWVAWVDDYNASKPYIMYTIINDDTEMLDRISDHFAKEEWFNMLIQDIRKEI